MEKKTAEEILNEKTKTSGVTQNITARRDAILEAMYEFSAQEKANMYTEEQVEELIKEAYSDGRKGFTFNIHHYLKP